MIQVNNGMDTMGCALTRNDVIHPHETSHSGGTCNRLLGEDDMFQNYTVITLNQHSCRPMRGLTKIEQDRSNSVCTSMYLSNGCIDNKFISHKPLIHSSSG